MAKTKFKAEEHEILGPKLRAMRHDLQKLYHQVASRYPISHAVMRRTATASRALGFLCEDLQNEVFALPGGSQAGMLYYADHEVEARIREQALAGNLQDL